jgi:hypothetical protein
MSQPEALRAALQCCQAGRYEEALPHFAAVLADPAIPQQVKANALAIRSFTHLDIYRHFDAWDDANESIKLDPRSFQGNHARIFIQAEWGPFEPVLAAIDSFIATKPPAGAVEEMNRLREKVSLAISRLHAFQPPERQSSERFYGITRPKLTPDLVANLFENLDHNIPFKDELVAAVGREILEWELAHPGPVRRIDTTDKVIVVGDLLGKHIHRPLRLIFAECGFPSKTNRYLFNGNFLNDTRSVSLFLSLLLIKIVEPDSIYFNQGIFESADNLRRFDFELHSIATYGAEITELLKSIIRAFPIATVLNGSVFVINGGISEPSTDLGAVAANSFYGEPSDIPGIRRDPAIPFWTFGPDITAGFLTANSFTAVVRSSQSKVKGFECEHDGKVITVFSSRVSANRPVDAGVVSVTGTEVTPKSVSIRPNLFISMPYEVGKSRLNGIFWAWRRDYQVDTPTRLQVMRIQSNSPERDFLPPDCILSGEPNFGYMTAPVQGSCLFFIFQQVRVGLEAYTIQSARLNPGNDHMKTWKLLGTNDGTNWVLLDEQTDVDELNGPGFTETFPVANHEPFVAFQLLQHERNHRGNWNLCLEHFEIFGTVTH